MSDRTAYDWIDDIERMQGGPNGPTIRLRACVLEMDAAKARKPLTDEQIDAVWDEWFGSYGLRGPAGPYTRRGFARALEKAHGIGAQRAG